jgi:phosphoglycerol transferase MdoB-like AlkP superfamily enzyme
MRFRISYVLQRYLPFAFSLSIVVCLIRVYEYIAVASKVFGEHAYKFEFAGLLYDVWLSLVVSLVFFIPFALLYLLHHKLAVIVGHVLNVLVIICYIALIITFSERNTPFDHELFTRNLGESIETAKQMTTSGFSVYVPFIIYIALYFLLYAYVFKRTTISKPLAYGVAAAMLLSMIFVQFSNPSPKWFKQTAGYYLASNKLTYWAKDSYKYFRNKNKYNSENITDKQLLQEINFYQQNQPFHFTSLEYPLLHANDEGDVLGNFFNLSSTPPNIVILVVEGLSSDFSGAHAYASSFTPFLDSLAAKSLSWENFLSTAPGTFAAHPAISGSLPYGRKGFSMMNVMPDHLSLIKILHQNGYYTNFMIGFDPDFDNMGGYIRLQGIDFLLNNYPSKYKEMGIGEEGWSMGYPDDALFERSFEVLDSIKKQPYLNIYHTATSHMPFLFEQKPAYEKLFDKKLKTLQVTPKIRKTLQQTKSVLTTFMFSDDCLRKFFADYAKRPEYSNTIFFITGDHHIGAFPTTCPIDEYHVPLIVYSPMLKKPQQFLSVNSHNNLAPTITQLITKNYHTQYAPKDVHWLGDVMDTSTAFRNIHSMPFMSWSRDISDYMYKGYFISDEQLYKLAPNLLLEPYANDTLREHMTRMRENFKIINAYVCEKNKVYPQKQNLLPGEKVLLKEFSDSSSKLIYSKLSDTTLSADFAIPHQYKYLYVEASAKVNMPDKGINMHPTLRFALVDTKNNGRKYLNFSKREIATLSKGDFVPQQWNSISTNDLFPLEDYKNVKDFIFETAIWTDSIPIKMKIQNLDIKVFGIKESR